MFAKKMQAAASQKRSLLCVTVNPCLDGVSSSESPWTRIAERQFSLNKAAIDAIAPLVVGVVINPALYQISHQLCVVLEWTIRYAQSLNLAVILDANYFGDSTAAEACAAMSIGEIPSSEGTSHKSSMRSDAVTICGYAGASGIYPYVDAIKNHGTGAFVVCKTPYARESMTQALFTTGGVYVWEGIARMVSVWSKGTTDESGYTNLGIAVDSVSQPDAARIRECLPRSIVLVSDYDARRDSAVMDLIDTDGFGAILVPRTIASGDYLFDTPRLAHDVDVVRTAVNAAIQMRRRRGMSCAA